MSGVAAAATATGFGQVTNIYTSGSSATETVPAGATQCVLTIWGGGASGGFSTGGGLGGGGGGGGKSTKTVSVSDGQTFTYSVGAAVAGRSSLGDGTNGNASSVTSAAPSVSMTANGGAKGTGAAGSDGTAGAGGTASGGTTNTSGSAGSGISGGAGGGGDGIGNGGTGVASGTSGAGSVGTVQFVYT